MSGDNDEGNCKPAKCCGCFALFCLATGITLFIEWPRQISAAVDSATIRNLTVVFNFSSAAADAATVSYHLDASLNFYNHCYTSGVTYDGIDSELRSGDAVLAPAANDTFPTQFYQPQQRGSAVRVAFDGRGVGVATAVASELEKIAKGEEGSVLSLELDLEARVTHEIKWSKAHYGAMVRCSLSIPVKSEKGEQGSGGGALASSQKCKVKYGKERMSII